MKKHLILFLVTLLLVLTGGNLTYSAENGELTVNAKSAVLIEASTGRVLLDQNSQEKLPPASVTKIMTILLIYDAVEQGKITWNDVVTVSEHAASMGGSQVFLEPNEQQTVETLTKCIVIASANDASVAMAEFIGGSEDAFVDLMNKKAAELGMENTHFKNACGLDANGHLTTAYDISLMSRELINKYPQVLDISKIWQDTIIHKTRRGDEEFGLTNTNKLLKWYQGSTGLKTGSTGKALYCLSGTAEKNGMKLIGVVLAAPDYKVRFQEVMKMFDYGFANYVIQKGESAGQNVGTVSVHKGNVDTVNAIIKEDVNVLIEKGKESALEKKVELLPSISAPADKGTMVGEIIYYFNGKEVGKSEIVTDAKIEKAAFKDMFIRLLNKLL